MEKLNNGCEYCNSKQEWNKPLIKSRIDENLKIEIEKYSNDLILNHNANSEHYVADRKKYDFCINCGKNLKTGNPMVEIKPLQFPSYEKFKTTQMWEKEILEYDFEIEEIHGEIRAKVEHVSQLTPVFVGRFEHTKQGYNRAILEIKRIRLRFVIELAEG